MLRRRRKCYVEGGIGGGEEEMSTLCFPSIFIHENLRCNVVVPPAGGAHLHYVDDAQVRLLR